VAGTLNSIKNTYKDKVSIIINHTLDGYDNYSNTKAKNRSNYYELKSVPQDYVDGFLCDSNNAAKTKQYVIQRLAVTPQVEIAMGSTCQSSTGTVTVKITNTSQTSIQATLQVVLVENAIKDNWATGFTTVDFVNRDMLPDEKGEALTIAAGQTITKTRNFTLDSRWVKNNCRLTGFLQKSNREIIQGCEIGLNQILGTIHTDNLFTNYKLCLFKITNKSLNIFMPSSERYKISIYTLNGKKIRESILYGNNTWCDMQIYLEPGIYLTEVTSTNKTFYKKIVLY